MNVHRYFVHGGLYGGGAIQITLGRLLGSLGGHRLRNVPTVCLTSSTKVLTIVKWSLGYTGSFPPFMTARWCLR